MKKDLSIVFPSEPLDIPLEELRELALRAKTGDEEATELVLRGLYKLIYRIAGKIALFTGCAGRAEEDLFQAGLIYAAHYLRRYDGSTAVTTYIWPCVWGRLLREAKRFHMSEAGVRVPVKTKTQEGLASGHPVLRSVVRYHQTKKAEEEEPLFATIPGPPHPFDRGLELEDVHRQVEGRLRARLGPRKRDIMRRRFGIGFGKPQFLESIGKHYDLSRQRVQQLEDEARIALGMKLGPDMDEDGASLEKESQKKCASASTSMG